MINICFGLSESACVVSEEVVNTQNVKRFSFVIIGLKPIPSSEAAST